MGDSAARPSSAFISIDGVTSRYGRHIALNNLTFSSGSGVCALLGPNGAGKTTLMSAVMGQKQFDGSISINGESSNPKSFRRSRTARDVGYLPQRFDLAAGLRVGETVAYAAWCNGRARHDCPQLSAAALDKVGLTDKHRHKVRTLSGGERQRLGIACALAHNPAVLLLDEPTVGLDPTQRARLRTYLIGIAESTSVIIATHLLEDVHVVADRVVVINEGSVVFEGSKDEMAQVGRRHQQEHESPLETSYRLLISEPDNG